MHTATEHVEFEAFSGLEFWDRYGVGSILHARAQGKGSTSLMKRFELFKPEFLELSETFTICSKDQVVGLAGCTPDFFDEAKVVLSYVNVDPQHRGNGYASKLCQEMLAYMHDKGVRYIECDGYSEMGLKAIRPVLVRESECLGMVLRDNPVVKLESVKNQGFKGLRF